jgi:hypothetical protein
MDLVKVLIKMVSLVKVLITVVFPMKMVLIIKVLIARPIKVLDKVTFRILGPTIPPIMVLMRMVLTTPVMDLIIVRIMFLIKVLIVRIMFLIKVPIRMVLITLVVVVVPTLIVIDVFPSNPCSSNNNKPLLVVVDHPHLLHPSFALLLMDTIISMIPIILIIMGSMIISMIIVHMWA